MKQLSGADNLFLYQERGNQTAHVGSLAIYDPSSAPGGKVRFKSVLAHFTRRMLASVVYRRRLVRAPLDLDRPYWIDEPEIDVEYHVRHIALPHPGDWRQLMIQVARIHARPLDLTKPAWEAYVIEGLDNIPDLPAGSFAVYTKMHHAVIDGQAGAMLLKSMHTLTPEVESAPQVLTTIADRVPTRTELLLRMIGNRARQARLAAGLVVDLAPLALDLSKDKLGKVLNRSRSEAGARAGGKVPHTRFNAPLSPHRVIESRAFALADFQRVREAVAEVTLNDVFLATCGGAVRKYLEAKGELPASALRVQVPVSTRSEKQGTDAGNQVSLTITSLCSDIADPFERLRRVAAASQRTKRSTARVGKDLPARVSAVAPAFLLDKLMRLLVVPTFNLTVSNVRGPSEPLYLAGARLHALIPINMLIDGMALSITGFSTSGMFWVSVVADRKAVPDPGFFSQCLTESFEELLRAATKTTSAAPAQPAGRAAAKPKAATTKPQSRRKPAAPAPGAQA